MERDEYRTQDPTGGLTGEDSGLQANNLSPRGQGQPKKKKKKPVDSRVVMQPYQDDQVDSRYNRFNQPTNQRMPGVPQALGGAYDQAYGNAGPALNPQVEQARHMMAGSAPDKSMVAQWMQRNGGVNGKPQMPQVGALTPEHMNMSPTKGGLHDAFKQSVANNYTDIQDTNPWQTGDFMGQLQGFNTQGWGSGERGSGTLKNRFGQIASRYDVTKPGALAALMQDPQFQEMTGGQATIVEHPNQDLIDFDGPNGPMAPVDVIGNATEGGAGQNWWWGPTDQQGGGPQAPANQIYNQALQMPGQMPGMPPGGLEGFDPQQQQGQAMQFLQWLLQQQQQGNMINGGLGDAPMF